eukprot:3884186-Pleurochrysis_carterae.AAC.1
MKGRSRHGTPKRSRPHQGESSKGPIMICHTNKGSTTTRRTKKGTITTGQHQYGVDYNQDNE